MCLYIYLYTYIYKYNNNKMEQTKLDSLYIDELNILFFKYYVYTVVIRM